MLLHSREKKVLLFHSQHYSIFNERRHQHVFQGLVSRLLFGQLPKVIKQLPEPFEFITRSLKCMINLF